MHIPALKPYEIINENEPLMISALADFVFCPRRCALKQIEGLWGDNQHTMAGTLLHTHADEPGYETSGDVTVLRALPLYSARYGLSGKADIVEIHDDNPVPVEYKKGRKRSFENDDIQLCAPALCLEEMFKTEVSSGYVYHASSRRRREVIFDWQLRELTAKAISEVREMLATERVPPAVPAPQCDGCSLRAICMPELTRSHTLSEWIDYERDLWAG